MNKKMIAKEILKVARMVEGASDRDIDIDDILASFEMDTVGDGKENYYKIYKKHIPCKFPYDIDEVTDYLNKMSDKKLREFAKEIEERHDAMFQSVRGPKPSNRDLQVNFVLAMKTLAKKSVEFKKVLGEYVSDDVYRNPKKLKSYLEEMKQQDLDKLVEDVEKAKDIAFEEYYPMFFRKRQSKIVKSKMVEGASDRESQIEFVLQMKDDIRGKKYSELEKILDKYVSKDIYGWSKKFESYLNKMKQQDLDKLVEDLEKFANTTVEQFRSSSFKKRQSKIVKSRQKEAIMVTIRVELGDEAMQNGEDASKAIQKYMKRVLKAVEAERYAGGKIMDLNGNSVGIWEVNPYE